MRLHAVLSRPFLPDASDAMLGALGLDAAAWPDDAAAALAALPAGHPFAVPDLLFAKLDDARPAELEARFAGSRRCVPIHRRRRAGSDLRATDVPDPRPQPLARTPIVTYALIALNVVVFLGYLPLLGDEARLAAFFDRWALIPARFTAGEGYCDPRHLDVPARRAAAHRRQHAVPLDLRRQPRGRVRAPRLPAFYLACGIAAALAQVLPAPARRSRWSAPPGRSPG